MGKVKERLKMRIIKFNTPVRNKSIRLTVNDGINIVSFDTTGKTEYKIFDLILSSFMRTKRNRITKRVPFQTTNAQIQEL